MGALAPGEMKHLTGGKSGAAGQSVPRFRCQECHGALAVVGVADRLPASGTFVAHPKISHPVICPSIRTEPIA